MKNINRRHFIKGSAYLGAATGGLSSSLAKAAFAPPTAYSHQKCVVIGSGFGGSVTALRLAKAGHSTALIERGRWWPYVGENSFPVIASAQEGDGRTTWLSNVDATSGQLPVSRYTGLLERIPGDTSHAVVGAGLGGGSLVYGGVLLKPRRDIFETALPNINFSQMENVYYPRVLSKVSGGSIPEDILNSPAYGAIKSFIEGANGAGFDVTRSDVGFNWNIIRQEISGERVAAASIGEYVYGCNSNAKNTLDKNYIAEAARTGKARIYTQHNVTTITESRGGGYNVHCDILSEEGNLLSRHVISCKYLFMAAGSLNTSKLLLKAKAQGDLTGVNDMVGQSFAGNGDELVGRLIYNPQMASVQGGPPCVAAHDPANPIKPVTFMHAPSTTRNNLPDGLKMQLQMSMSIPDALGSISYDPVTDKPVLSYPFDANELDRQAHLISLSKLPHVENGVIPGTGIGDSQAIWHPLGGAVMGEACSDVGELYGQPNLYVMDGSLFPGSTAAANPSLTIAANAERIMEALIPQLV